MTLVTGGLLGPLLVTGVLGTSTPTPPPTPTPSLPPAPSAGIDVVSAAVAWWGGQTAAQALTATGQLWHLQAPEDAQLPYATVFLVSEVAEIYTTRRGLRLYRSSLQFNFHAQTDYLARLAAITFRGLFEGAPLIIGSSDIDHCLPDGDGIAIGDGLGPGGRDCWVATETFDLVWTP